MALLAQYRDEVEKQLKTYQSCSADQQAVLRALAAIYQEVNQTTLNRILDRFNATGVFIQSGLEPRMDAQLKNSLIAKGLLQVKQSNFRLHPMLSHSLMLEALELEELPVMLEEVQVELPLFGRFDHHVRTPMQKARHIRHCLYLKQFEQLPALLERNAKDWAMKLDEAEIVASTCFYPYQQAYIEQLPQSVIHCAFQWIFNKARLDGEDNASLIEPLNILCQNNPKASLLQTLLAEQYLRRVDLNNAQYWLKGGSQDIGLIQLSGVLAFMNDNLDGALEHFDRALALTEKAEKKKRAYLNGLSGIFYCLALLKKGYESDHNRLNQLLTMVSHLDKDNPGRDSEKQSFLVLAEQARAYIGQAVDVWFIDINARYYEENEGLVVGILLSSLCFTWQGQKVPGVYRDKLVEYFDAAVAAKQFWLAHPLARLLFQSKQPYKEATSFLRHYKHQGVDLYALVKPKEKWQQVLDQLVALNSTSQSSEEKDHRIAWWIYREQFPHKVEARAQKRTKKGWTKGRVIPLKRLKEEIDTVEGLTALDHHIIDQIATIKKDSYYSYESYETYTLTGYAALKGCVGHPNVFFADKPQQAINIVQTEPELVISTSKSGYNLFMPGIHPDVEDWQESYNLIEQGAHRHAVVKFNQKHQLIADIIGHQGLNIPKKAKNQVLDSVKSIAPFLNIHSDIAELNEFDLGGEPVDPDTTLYINIQPSGAGLQMECLVQPLGQSGPSQWPGLGNPMVMATVDGQSLKTTRDLEHEKSLFDTLKSDVPQFNNLSAHVLQLEELEDALVCLEALQQVQTPKLVLQWPKGKALKVSSLLDSGSMTLSMSREQQWFNVDGQLQVDENQVMALSELLGQLDKAQGRFIPMGEDKFLALTDKLKQQLTELDKLTINGKAHSAIQSVLEQTLDGMALEQNEAWQQQAEKLKQAFELKVEVPTNLQAQLRDYQLEGYDWASRLAYWGAGACLADDMGLGKTLQTLTLMLARGSGGPALVLAPVSVCFNWQQEAMKFAPALNVKVLSDGDKRRRRDWLKSVAGMDVIVCSYGLLQSEFDLLHQINWHTLVADEAQALKNPEAKRTQLACRLTGEFKMVATGTPIENNLSELWSLFEFINPGLLGTREQFNQKFAGPIESMLGTDAAKQAQQSLRKIIAPFILRRLKSEVLSELPSRTQINLTIEQSPQEAAFYEALRRQALDTMLRSTEQAGQKRLKILAELMRLRRACCHPSLVSDVDMEDAFDDSEIHSSKLNVFDNLVDELRQGHHRALVFSQFVGHLAILREHLQQKGISFQYLDGSTSAAKRKKAVNAFQAGEGDLFLISLKAGGSGLNLTAADYVIHMDPWWNPAVEDQASDRAHRMGQTRPVTIYRLITQNTIEDKIMALHQQKRDLADSLLDGTDIGGSLNYEDMLDLLQG